MQFSNKNLTNNTNSLLEIKFLAIFALLFLATTTLAQDCAEYDETICVGLTDGFHASPELCTNWIVCEEGVLDRCGVCPNGLYFDPIRGGCTYTVDAECESGAGAALCTPGLVSRVPSAASCTVYFQCIGGK